MKEWDAELTQEHEQVAAQVNGLEIALRANLSAQERQAVLAEAIRKLAPFLESHFHKEERVCFSTLQRMTGCRAGVLLLVQELKKIRGLLKHLEELLRGPAPLEWEGVTLAVDGLIEILEDHEKKEDYLIVEVLRKNLKPAELEKLARAYHQAGEKESSMKSSHGGAAYPQ